MFEVVLNAWCFRVAKGQGGCKKQFPPFKRRGIKKVYPIFGGEGKKVSDLPFPIF